MIRPSHPDLPNFFVHFTGRPRHYQEKTPAGIPPTAEERLVGILEEGRIRAFSSFSSPPVVCVSESTRKAVATMVTSGPRQRRAYEPWGLLLRRQAAIDRGFRPVLHVSRDERQRLDSSPFVTDAISGRFVTYEPPSVDWLHEREWRLVFDASAPNPVLPLDELAAAVIVPDPDWVPPRDRDYSSTCAKLERMHWTGQEFVSAGNLP